MKTKATATLGLLLASCVHGLCAPSAPASCACCKQEAPDAYSRDSIYQLDARFTDDQGRPFSIGSLKGRPVVIDMFFTSCSYACPLTVTDMLALEGKLPADQRGRAVFVLVSFDSRRDTAAVLAQYRRQRHLDGHWILLNGADDGVRELAALLGVRYRQEADGTFSHSNILTVLNPKGEIAYQRIGLEGGVAKATLAVEAAMK